jgi:AcrR family transcriptional regulator
MVLEIHKPNIPKQDRSLKRYQVALKTADSILEKQGIHFVTLKEIAKLSGIKRSSLYKFFPSNLAILYALSENHLDKLLNMIDTNTVNTNFRNAPDFIMLIIDLLAIYLNEHKGSAIIFLSNDLPAKLDINLHINKLFASEVINKINSKLADVDSYRLNNTLSIIAALLSQGHQEVGEITPRTVNEIKRASLAYLSAY